LPEDDQDLAEGDDSHLTKCIDDFKRVVEEVMM